METDLPSEKSLETDGDGVPEAAVSAKTPPKSQVGPSPTDPSGPMAKASRDAEIARTAARQAIIQAFRHHEESLKKAATLVKTCGQIKSAGTPPIPPAAPVNGHAGPAASPTSNAERNSADAADSQKALADILKAYIGNRSYPGIKKDHADAEVSQPDSCHQPIGHAVDDPIKEKTLQLLEAARSDRIASKLAVSQAREEVRKARAEADASRREAEEAINLARGCAAPATRDPGDARSATNLLISQAQQQALNHIAEEMKQAREDVKAAKEAAAMAVRLAQDEARKVGEEFEAYKKDAQGAIAALEGRLAKIIARLKDNKQRSLLSVVEAQAEVEKTRQACRVICEKAQLESQQAREEAETAVIRANDALIKAQQDVVGLSLKEIGATRRELEEAVQNPVKLLNAPV